MWPRSAPGSTASLLLLLLLCFWLPYTVHFQGLGELSPPVNLSIHSKNLKAILTWGVNRTFAPTNFSVEWKTYTSEKWKAIETCSNISVHHCDLTGVFSLTEEHHYYARVMAFTQFKISPFAFTAKFTFKENATLDAPNVTVHYDGKNLIVEINHTVAHTTSKIMRNILQHLSYLIDTQNGNENRSYQVNCSEFPCVVSINIAPKLVPQENCCVIVQGYVENVELYGKRSQQKCVLVQFNGSKDSRLVFTGTARNGEVRSIDVPKVNTYQIQEIFNTLDESYYSVYQMGYDDYKEETFTVVPPISHQGIVNVSRGDSLSIILAVSMFIVIVLVVLIIYGIKKFNKKKLVLPESLAHLLMGGSFVDVRTEENNISVVTKIVKAIKIDDSAIPCLVDLGDETQTEKKSCQDIVNSGKTDLSNHALDSTSVNNIDVYGTDQVGADLDSFEVGKIGLNRTDVDSVIPDEPVAQTTNSDNMSPVSTMDNWGYDKPHALLDMFINCTDEQNGYRKASSAVEVD